MPRIPASPFKPAPAGILALALLLLGWHWLSASHRGCVEIVVLTRENARCVVSVNLVTRKVEREKVTVHVSSSAFEQTIRVELDSSQMHSLGVGWRYETPEAPEIRRVRLLDESNSVVWEAADLQPQWRFRPQVFLASESQRTFHKWMGITAVVLGLGMGLGAMRRLDCGFTRRKQRPVVFVGTAAAGFLGMALLYGWLIMSQRDGPIQGEVWVHELAMEKAALADALPSPRTLLLGGSSGLYGVDAAWLSDRTPHQFANLSMHGGLPLEAHLRRCLETLRSGDLVLMHLEYSYWSRAASGKSAISDWQIDQNLGWTGVVDKLLWTEPKPWDLLVNVPPDRLLGGLLAKWYREAMPTVIPGRVVVPAWGEDWHLTPFRARLDDHGDLLPGGLNFAGKAAASVYIANPFAADKDSTLRELNEFIKTVRTRGSAVCFAWPATIRSELCDFRPPLLKAWTRDAMSWIERDGAHAVGIPEETQLPIEMFLDTNYHLTPEGREVHTARLLKQLLASGWPAHSEKR